MKPTDQLGRWGAGNRPHGARRVLVSVWFASLLAAAGCVGPGLEPPERSADSAGGGPKDAGSEAQAGSGSAGVGAVTGDASAADGDADSDPQNSGADDGGTDDAGAEAP